MKIIPLKDGNFAVTKNKEFVLLENAGADTQLTMAVQPFLVITPNDYLLLDTGLGWLQEGEPVIFKNLEKENISPLQITKVLLSHLHKDHINGLVRPKENSYELNFPNAEIYIQKREYDYVLSKAGSSSFDFEILEFIIQNAHIIWMNEDQGQLTPEISFEVTGGHSPFHQVFWIKENNETFFYGADNLPQRVYLKYHVAYKSDFDGKKAMEQRIKWEEQAKEENWKILLYHDMKVPVLDM
ncbi:MBL fold metallo-hydrolase [Chryseobacterium sp.]|uniref:MBL fold metallo-hydrolase n=1 Tax=Chryseobacterium sp. TaxID=1871047 RepID=UPI0025BC49BD|nr:MBL fold metallo-hydrolase [Chryseobacterium sp.]